MLSMSTQDVARLAGGAIGAIGAGLIFRSVGAALVGAVAGVIVGSYLGAKYPMGLDHPPV